MRRKRLLFIVSTVLVLSAVSLGLVGGTMTAKADFNANNLIDDYIFDKTSTMDAGQIDSFLNSFPSSCISTRNGYAAADVTGYSQSTGYTYGGNVSAGTIIYHAAQGYGLNPQVLLTVLQKEQSLVTGGGSVCNSRAINAAMGFDCAEGNNCPAHAETTGFSQQIIHAAWFLRFGEQRSEGNTAWAEIHGSWNNSDDPPSYYAGPMTQGTRARTNGGSTAYYDGFTSIDGTAVHMDTGATAALYWYTPHFHGNQNFDTIFQAWFGATTGQGFERVIADNGDPRQWVVYGTLKQYIPDAQTIYAWNLQNTQLITMPASQLGAISTGPSLGRLALLNTGPSSLYFMDNGQRHKVLYPDMYNAWNFSGQVISDVSPGLFTQASAGSDLTYSVQDPSTGNVYMLDGGNNNGQTVLRHYQNSTLMAAWEGTTNYTAISTDYFSDINSAIGSDLTNTMVAGGGVSYEVMGGVEYRLWPSTAQLYPGPALSISAATARRLPQGGYISHLVQSNTSPAYLIDGGVKHQILWPDALNAWTGPNHNLSTVNDAFLALIPTGSSIGGYLADSGGQLYLVDHYKAAVPSSLDGAYRNSEPVFSASSALMSIYINSSANLTGYIKSPDSGSIYLLDSSGKLRHMEWPTKVDGWGGYSAGITQLSDYIVNSMGTAPSPAMFVSDGTVNYVMDGGKKWTVSSGIQANWGLSTPQTYADGTLNRFPTGGALDNKLAAPGNGYYAIVRAGMAYATVDPSIAGVWGAQNAPVMSTSLIPNLAPATMLTRFVKSSVQGDNRTFVVDNGNWYTVDNAQFANLGGPGSPILFMDPAQAPNTITAWTSVVVKDGGSTYYVIDGGGKRYFTNPQIFNQWTNFGSLTTPTVSDSFLNLLPTRGWVERAIKGSSPSVYSADNGTKRHILYPDTYNRYYAPFANVTDSLLNAMPTSSDI
jgi:hypothetical protein